MRKYAFLLVLGLALTAVNAAERIDVSALADGEVRAYGEGDRQVTATRDGDTVTISFNDGTTAADEVFVVSLDADAHGHAHVTWVDADGDEGFVTVRKIVELSPGSDVLRLECPEGDTTMRLGKDDTGPYFCPKHGLELEKGD